MKDRFQNFMVGRYGTDSFSRFLVVLSIISIFISFILGNYGKIFYLIAMCLLIYSYYRMFSRDYESRYKENIKYKDVFYRIVSIFRNQKKIWKQRKLNHIYTCPNCKQKIRIPKGKGNIVVTCPKCKKEFRKKS